MVLLLPKQVPYCNNDTDQQRGPTTDTKKNCIPILS
jgi:hypothetical protein